MRTRIEVRTQVDLFLTPLADDLAFPEAPRWRDGRLWFSDMISRRVCTLISDGSLESVAMFDEMPGGIGFISDGTALVVGMTSGCLYAIGGDRLELYADLSGAAGTHLDDMAVASDGTAYVGAVGDRTDSADVAPAGAIVRVSPDGAVSLEAEGLAFPNGAVITADGRRLLVNETFAERITAFDIDDTGALSGRRTWAALPGLHPDGLTVDDAGDAWVGCYQEQKFIRVREGGEITDTIPTAGRWATGVELGGPDGHTLFVCTADTDHRRFFRGDSQGRIDTVRVDVPAGKVAP